MSPKRAGSMKITNLQKTPGAVSERGFTNLCTFTVEITPELKLYGLRLIEAPDGNLVLGSPETVSGSRPWSMSPALRNEIAQLAYDEIDVVTLKRFAKLVRL